MADINKCDIEGQEKRTAYRLKEGVPIAIFDMDSYFEPFEMPVVELKETDWLRINGLELNLWSRDDDIREWEINLCKYGDTVLLTYIGENQHIKSIEDFNNKAAHLFGFYLKEPEGAEK